MLTNVTYHGLMSVINVKVKVLVGTFNQEKAFSVIVKSSRTFA